MLLGQTNLFKGVKTSGLLSSINNRILRFGLLLCIVMLNSILEGLDFLCSQAFVMQTLILDLNLLVK